MDNRFLAKHRAGIRGSIVFGITVVLGVISSKGIGAEPLDAEGFRSSVRPFVQRYCVQCHGPESQEADLRLDDLAADFSDSSVAGKWIEVMDNLNLGEMPPEDEPQPPDELRARVTNWISVELKHAQLLANGTGGRVLMRRLSRTEYANAVRDLLDVEFLPGEGPQDLLPPDGTLNGFDKVGKALLLDPSLMENYFAVAQRVAEKAIVTGAPPVPTRINRMEYEEISGGIEYIKKSRSTIVTPDGILSMAQGMRSDEMLRHPWNDQLIPIRGNYKLRLRVGADPKDREGLYIRVSRGGDGDLYVGKVTGTLAEPELIEVERAFDVPGSSEIGIQFENSPDFGRVNYLYSKLREQSEKAIASKDARLAGRLRAQMGAQGFPNQGRLNPETRTTDHLPRIFFDWIELEGPIYDQWPPRSTQRIFFRGLPDADASREDQLLYAHEIFARLLPRAFRRPVRPEEIASIVGVVGSELEHGETMASATQSGLIAMLCSPSFLLTYEPNSQSDGAPRGINDFELATRLSLFLWSSIPDDPLYRQAMAKELRDQENLLTQVRRMLDDPRSDALVDGFARQWFKADEFDRFAIDRNLYRDFYRTENVGLNEAINAEPLEFFRHILNEEGSVLDFLDADWTMANGVLANYYGIPDVQGERFVRVSLPPQLHRGGLTTMAAIHKWGSDGNRTKPVERGKYILDVLFNDPPKPPPPNVGEVEPNVKGEDLTVRQRLDQHRTIAACANCHRTIDPYGLALENFNVVGKWRTKQDGERGWWPDEAVIDSSGTLPNGVHFENVEEFRAALRQQDDRFLRGLCEKMFTYALGRTVEPTDRATIDHLVDHVKKNGHTLRSLIEGIVLTQSFLSK